MSGTIPRSLLNARNLVSLSLQRNRFEGRIDSGNFIIQYLCQNPNERLGLGGGCYFRCINAEK